MDSPRQVPREDYEKWQQDYLQQKATPSTDAHYTHRQYPQAPDDFRTEFQRDYTRIIHSRAFRRLRHKTQVFVYPKNDHLCTRMEHSLHVASVARTIARALRLNEDLVTAIAVGHDLGHAPFGHMGEKSLQRIADDHGLWFCHELHSLRVVDYVESPYKEHHGLNLTFAVRDGIVCHYGEQFEQSLAPDRTKPFDVLINTRRGHSRPASLEGCVVRWADKVAYLGRDLEDAITLGLVEKDEVPDSVTNNLGISNRDIIASLVRELCRTRAENGEDKISVGDEIHKALNDFYAFNMKGIYQRPEATKYREQIDRAMKLLFAFLLDRVDSADGNLEALKKGGRTLDVFVEFLRDDIRNWNAVGSEQLVIDFIAGMTDSFFIDSFTELFLPRSIV